MAKRFVGREAIFRGKTLFEICCNLRNFGEGRVVYRHNHLKFRPEPSYFRLTKVEPDMADETRQGGVAWAEKVYRGHNEGLRRIDSGYKRDWWLVPKDQEEEFCKITAVQEKKPEPPSHIPCPPLLELIQRSEAAKSGQSVGEGPLRLPLILEPNARKLRRQKTQNQETD